MEFVTEISESAVLIFLSVFEWVIVARCVLSLFASEESKVMEVCYAVTEPIVSPIRNLLQLIPAMEDFPIDLSFMATYFVLEIFRIILLSVS